MSKSTSLSAVRTLIMNEFGEGTFFTKEELWFRFHEKYIYSTRKELESIISSMAQQNLIEIKSNQDGKELIGLPQHLKSTTEKNRGSQCSANGNSNENFQVDRKALKEIKENELNLRHLKPQ